MRLWRSGLVVLAASGCDDPAGPPGVAAEDLIGAWTAVELRYTNPADPTQSVDLIARGTSMVLTIGDNMTFATFTTMDGATEASSGTVAIAQNRLALNDTANPDGPVLFTVTLIGPRLELINEDESWDFDEDGRREAATSRLVLSKE